jgi:MFS transporter, FLVCR family, MFS-domain-containing protein 7
MHHHGPRSAFIISGISLILGSGVRYAGTVASGGNSGVIAFANLVLGAGTPFSLILQTHYSNLWFSPKGRIGATALAALGNPAGSAVSARK